MRVGNVVKVLPNESTTVAVTVALPDVAKCRDVPEPSASCSVIELTGQVWKFTGLLVTPPTEAEIWVMPGSLAVANTWLVRSPDALVFSFAIVVLACDQVNGPTAAVTSTP